MFPSGGGSSQTVAQEPAAPQPRQGLDFFRAIVNLNSHPQQPASTQFISSLSQQPIHAAQLATQQHSPSISLLQQGISRQVAPQQEVRAEQANQTIRDDLHRRPSLMSNFFPTHLSSQQGTSRDDTIHLDIDAGGSFPAMKIDPSPGAATSLSERELEEAEKKATSDRLESIEKDRKQADQQVEVLTKRRERLKNIKKESEQEVKEETNGEVDERENAPLWLRILSENKRKPPVPQRSLAKRSAEDQVFFEPFNLPSVTALIKRHRTYEPKIRQVVLNRHRLKLACFRYNDEAYNNCMREYLRKLERWENHPKKVARDAKNREIFERAFPEMKRSREEKERTCRTDRISLRGQDHIDEQPTTSEKGQVDEEYKMRNAAAIPPLLKEESDLRPLFLDNDHAIIKNAAEENKKWIESSLASWSNDEKKLFQERLSVVGKNYANIAMFLENKTVQDCVQYYYLCKKRENFKSLIPKRKRKLAKTYKPPVMPTAEELAMHQLVPQDASTDTPSASQESKCVMCQLRIDPAKNPGRVLTRSNYEMYGIDARKQGADCRICTKCKDEVLKIRNSGRCMVKMCASGRRKVKATKAMPAKWRQMDDRQRSFMITHLSIPREIVKCCGPCFKRISKKLDSLFAGELDEEIAKFESENHQTWESEEISRLQDFVSKFGTDWNAISEEMEGRSAEDCRRQYESLCKKDEDEEEDFEEDGEIYKSERQEDDIAVEEDTQDVPDSSMVSLPDIEGEVDITEVPTTSNADLFENTCNETKPNEEAQAVPDQQPSTSSGLVKGSITAGTPYRPPSVSIIEQPACNTQLPANVGAVTPSVQPPTTQAMIGGFDHSTLMQIHQLLGGDENRTRAILEQYQQQQRNYQQLQQHLIQQQPSMDQLYLTYSQLSEADLNRIYPTVDLTTRCIIEYVLQHKKQTASLQMRQQHAAMLGQIQAKQQMEARQLEQQRQEQRLQQEKQRQIEAAKKQLLEQIKHHDITAANIDKNTIAMVHRVGEINQSLQTASLTQLQRQQLLLEYSSQSAKCSSLQTMAQNHRLQRTQLQNQLDALNAGSGSAAAVASMSLSASPRLVRTTHETSASMDDEQRLREEIEKIDEDIRGMEKQVRRLEEDERTYQKKKIQAEQMITSAFRINSTVQDYQAKQDLKEAQDNMRVVEHSRLTFQKKLDNLRETRELLIRQQRMLLNSSTASGVIVGGSSGVGGKGTVKDFAASQQQQVVKGVQQSPSLSLAQAQVQAQHFQLQLQQQQQQQQHKNLIGIRQPTADSKPPTTAHSSWLNTPSASKDRENHQWNDNKRSFNNVLDKVVHEELTHSHAAAQAAHAAAHSSIPPPEIRRKSGLEMLNIPSVSVPRHPQRRPASPAVGAVGIQRPPMNRPARSIMGNPSSFGALAINTSHAATGSPQMSAQNMSPSVSAPSSSAAPSVYAHFQQSLNVCSPASQLSKPQPLTSPAVCVQKSEVPSAIVQPLTSSSIVSTSAIVPSATSAFQEPSVSTPATAPPPPTLQFLTPSTVSAEPLTYEPISPADSVPASPVTRAEAPSTAPASIQGPRMFSALDFDFPLAVPPSGTAPAPPPPSMAPPLVELLRTASTEGVIPAAMTFEPLSDDED